LGIGPEVLVGICVERSIEMLVGLLGILKAGGAYLPLDPTYPPERLAFMLQDARVKLLVTEKNLSERLPSGGERRVCLDAEWPLIAEEPGENRNSGVTSRNLAYVLYTSGSTGKPKGVMVEHWNVVNFFAGMDDRIKHGPGSAWLAVTSPSFDISVLELFWTLSRGLKVVLYAGDQGPIPSTNNHRPRQKRPMEFSLFYFSSNQEEGPGGAYRLLTEGARFADGISMISAVCIQILR
jgi:non-ribosomal peptide synthetase component F